ncbi:MAG: xanthine dehydrogenase family protein molybdopterin-binding subunit [Sphingobium sp.]|nr:xanthine dehydrogenase family protein molybdopterin-binding subunit [Sphingobium sp.]MBP6110754.1 xanthine dehydrogenase family protein molybdopterin-binding subunit [Sphingobium sp.]MBP8671766.1 xanthine dehydrogenase family protein molybdopterin-binding subunit [Sphingobium sp.]MBP9157442.1 xanthine dehydrogenase family protein molybdopterin-binding subunit [Sphingobium sp.]
MRRANEHRAGGGPGLNRRSLLIGGGAAAGLLLAWELWPRHYVPNLATSGTETPINAFLKIDSTGQIITIMPQLEMGQGVSTLLPQILADELGADWRTVGVQAAPVSPLYANTLLAKEFIGGDWTRLAGGAGEWAIREYATRNAMMLTGGATSVRMFAQSYREAGAAARVLLCKAAAARWGVEWEQCTITKGVVSDGQRRLKIGELAGEAAGFTLPDILPLRTSESGEDRLIGQDAPRLDTPSKVDGSYNFAGDIRMPGLLFASIRQGPVGTVGLRSVNEAAANKVPGFRRLVRLENWVAAVATNWWAANKALDRLDPVFEIASPALESPAIGKALDGAFESAHGRRMFAQGDVAARFRGAQVVRADFAVAPALHLAMEPPSATARVADGRAQVWTASQAPAFCRAAVADALGMAATDVMLYPLGAGGSFGRRFDHDAAVQAALIAREVGAPVQLCYSRLEDVASDRPRPPAHARLWAKMIAGGRIEAMEIKVAAPAANPQVWSRIAHGASPRDAVLAHATAADASAVSGLPPLYAIPHITVDHFPADISLPVGRWRGNADSYTCFFTECFMDELAYRAGVEPMSFRLQHLSGQTRLARCLTIATAMGGWQGGAMGSGQGVAVHAMDGGFIAVLVDAEMTSGKLHVRRMVAAADLGAQPNPDIARQQIEGGLIFGLASAMGGAAHYKGGMPTRANLGRMGLPRLADIGEVTIELMPGEGAPAGIGQIGVPAVAPALAGALFTITGRRHRALPLLTPE